MIVRPSATPCVISMTCWILFPVCLRYGLIISMFPSGLYDMPEFYSFTSDIRLINIGGYASISYRPLFCVEFSRYFLGDSTLVDKPLAVAFMGSTQPLLLKWLPITSSLPIFWEYGHERNRRLWWSSQNSPESLSDIISGTPVDVLRFGVASNDNVYIFPT